MYGMLVTILTAVSLTAAHPSPPIFPRQAGPLVYVCEDTAWKGACAWQVPTANSDQKGDCLAIPYANTNLWLSFGPDKALKCAVYPEAGCKGAPMSIRYPGSAHFPGKDNEGGSLSFRCLPEDAIVSVDSNGKGDPYGAPKVIGS